MIKELEFQKNCGADECNAPMMTTLPMRIVDAHIDKDFLSNASFSLNDEDST